MNGGCAVNSPHSAPGASNTCAVVSSGSKCGRPASVATRLTINIVTARRSFASSRSRSHRRATSTPISTAARASPRSRRTSKATGGSNSTTGADTLQEGDGLGDTLLQLGKRRLGVGHRRRLDARKARRRTFGGIAGNLNLAREGMHVGREPRLEQRGEGLVFGFRLRHGLVHDLGEAFQAADHRRNGGIVDREGHDVSSLERRAERRPNFLKRQDLKMLACDQCSKLSRSKKWRRPKRLASGTVGIGAKQK